MKRFLLILTLGSAAFCGHAQQQFELDGQVNDLRNDDTIYLIYTVDNKQVADSSTVQDGRFVFKGQLQYPVAATLVRNYGPEELKNIQGRTLDLFKFYLEPTKFQVQAADSLKNASVVNSPLNQQYASLKRILKPTDDQFDALNKEYGALPEEQKKDSVTFNRLLQREKQILNDSYLAYLDFIRQYPESYLSLISLQYIAAQSEVNDKATKAYDSLADSLKGTPLAKDIQVLLAAPKKTSVGQVAPDFAQNTPDGKTVRLGDFRGKYVLIDFWASWCGPCREENPNVVAAYNRFKDQGFEIIGVSLDSEERKEAWLNAIQKDQLTWTQVSDLKGWDNAVAKLYGIRAIPANILLDPEGNIMAKDLREGKLQQKLAEIFQAP